MLLTDLLSKQLRFYTWNKSTRNDEIKALVHQQHFHRLSSKIRTIQIQANATESQQQIAKVLFNFCLAEDRRAQLIQLVNSNLLDNDVRLDSYGKTLLHRAVYNLDVELVTNLLANNANVGLSDYAGNTVLHFAIQAYRNGRFFDEGAKVISNLVEILTMLLETDSKFVNAKNTFGRTPLHYCVATICKQYLPTIVSLLLEYNADPDEVDSRLLSPFHCLIKRSGNRNFKQKCEVIKLMTIAGCDDLGLSLNMTYLKSQAFVKQVESIQAHEDSLGKSTQINKQQRNHRASSLKHLSRVQVVRIYTSKYKQQLPLKLPSNMPKSLSSYVNRQVLNQSDFI